MSEFSDIPREIGSADLPAGETVLWRGKPDWRHLALDAFGAPWVAFYFIGIGVWHMSVALHDGGTRAEALAEGSVVLAPMALALSLVALLAWLSARATVFTVTDRRIIMVYGVALPALINLPLHVVETMKVRRGFAGRGDLAFSLPQKGRLAFHQLWPYARPWHLFPASPMMRCVPKAEEVKVIVAGALWAAAEREALRLGQTVDGETVEIPAVPVAPAAQPGVFGTARPAGAAA
ncbi:photosynthetic complex putative assembly protein PuhB [Lichenibacterium dinghuense]|uniref:photosynthetic complex putative assembly protein PuhB n=1 Tax=Lichenibacterium dinghuense TaxID=2895977 RepID=UPI001F1E9CC2|nr:photosynthetic complex putative assembly protein PuhB [Lichenibacterium sp. 6Y81]